MGRIFGVVLATFIAVGCAKEGAGDAPAKAPEDKAAVAAPAEQAAAPAAAAVGELSASAKEAKTIFEQRCALCHGASGKGDGAAAATLKPKPRAYDDKAWQASVKDEDLAKAIVEGGAAIGKSMLMPPNPDLKDKPEVVAEIVKLIRSFAE